jgi:hypothetical protein
MSNSVSISQGNSFACVFSWTPGASGPVNLLATTITSTLEDRCGNSYALTVVTANDGLSFTVSYPGTTADWSLGLGRWDIKFVFPGSTVSRTEIFRVSVLDVVTV